MMRVKGCGLRDPGSRDEVHCGCTLIWDSGKFFTSLGGSAARRKNKIIVDGDIVHKNKVLARIRYYESRNCKTARKVWFL